MKRSSQINQHVMALITFFALVPLVYFIPEFVEQFLPAIKWLNVVIVVGIIVPIISYDVMPMAHFVLCRYRFWAHSKADIRGVQNQSKQY